MIMKQFFFLRFAIITVASFVLMACEKDDDIIEKEQAGDIPNGIQAVDLGLSVKWASFNLGADSIEGTGDYYAWGETETKSRYTWENYRLRADGNYYDGNITYIKYNTLGKRGTIDNKILLEESDDVVHLKWGGNWRIPTQLEFCELLDTNNCKWSWVTQKGIDGFKITSKKSGYTDQSIFLPVTGMFGAYSPNLDSNGNRESGYMTSSLNEDNPDCVWYLSFGRRSYAVLSNTQYRSIGQTIRTVCKSDSWIGITSIIFDKDSLKLLADANSNDFGESTIEYSLMSGDVEYNYYKKYVSWTSSDESVATVDSSGKVQAKSEGKAIITASYNGISTSCTVFVIGVNYNNSGSENGYGYVDLGLSVKWAAMNVGASEKEGFGNYYAWGETEPQTVYEWSSYRFWKSGDWGANIMFSKYDIREDGKTTLELEDDAAHVQLGGEWRIPSSDEMNEIINNCNWKWITLNGVNGMRVSSLKSGSEGNSIFLPAAGYCYSREPIDGGSFGHYCSNSIGSGSTYAANLMIAPTGHCMVNMSRCYGFPVRAVCP